MLLICPGILIPQKANHSSTRPLFSRAWALPQGQKDGQRGSLVWGPLLTLPAGNPSHPISSSPFLSDTERRGREEGCRSSGCHPYLKKQIVCCQLHSRISWSLIGGPLRNYVSQVFNPQVTKMNIHLYNLYYFLYLWIIHSGGAGWWPYLNLDLPFGLPQSCWGGLSWCDKKPSCGVILP